MWTDSKCIFKCQDVQLEWSCGGKEQSRLTPRYQVVPSLRRERLMGGGDGPNQDFCLDTWDVRPWVNREAQEAAGGESSEGRFRREIYVWELLSWGWCLSPWENGWDHLEGEENLSPPSPSPFKFHLALVLPHCLLTPPLLFFIQFYGTFSVINSLLNDYNLFDWLSVLLFCSFSLTLLPCSSNPSSKIPTDHFSETLIWSC